MVITENFKKLLKNLKDLDLPEGQFVVIGSGPLAVRGMRDTNDLDVVVTQDVWGELIKKYPVIVNSEGINRIDFGNGIETLERNIRSIFTNSSVVPFDEIFEKPDVFEGVQFMNLNHLKKIKLKMGREKDLADVKLIDEYLV